MTGHTPWREVRPRKRIALDYDGTIVASAWPDHGKPEPGAAAAIKRLMQQYEVVIFTTRIASRDVDEMTPRSGVEVAKEIRGIDRKLKQMGLPYIEVWQHPWKIGADVYVDDKAVWYDGDWEITEQVIYDRLERHV
jgi:hypothetical protein